MKRELKMKRHCTTSISAIFLFVLSLLSTIIVHEAKAVELRGAPSCGRWLEERRSGNYMDSESWLIGFLSGMAFGSNKNFLKGTDNPSIDAWMDNYCRESPLKHIPDGAEQLMIELVRQKGL